MENELECVSKSSIDTIYVGVILFSIENKLWWLANNQQTSVPLFYNNNIIKNSKVKI